MMVRSDSACGARHPLRRCANGFADGSADEFADRFADRFSNRLTGATAARLAGIVAVLFASAAAWAEVTLDTAVSKVETTLEAGGRAKRELVPAEDVVPGEELRYTITFRNDSDTLVDAGRIVITNPLPDGTAYVAGSAGGTDTRVEYSTDGETFSAGEPAGGAPASPGAESEGTLGNVRSLRWTYEDDLPPGASAEVYFHVRMQ